MNNARKVLALYRAEAARTGSYLVARQTIIARFKLTAAQADRIIAAGAQR